MSKEFEEWYEAALESLPTMSQFAKRGHCEEARLRHMFTAGRTLGRREMKGEAKELVDRLCDSHGRECFCETCVEAAELFAAIEAIPEEVEK